MKIRQYDNTINYFFTHNDQDAAGATVVENIFNAKEADSMHIYNCDYTTINDEMNKVLNELEIILTEANILYLVKIVDISINELTSNRITWMLSHHENFQLKLIDHHDNLYYLENLDWCIIDKSMSGCRLLYEKFYKNTFNFDDKKIGFIERFIDLVDLYDTWKWKKLDELEQKPVLDFQSWYNILGHEYFVDYYTHFFKNILNSNIENTDILNFYSMHDRCIIENYNKNIERKIESKVNSMHVVDRISYVISNDISITSLLGDTILSRYPDVKIAAIIYGKGVALRSRSTENYDVSLIAKRYGGGGHKNAAGFKYNGILSIAENLKLEL